MTGKKLFSKGGGISGVIALAALLAVLVSVQAGWAAITLSPDPVPPKTIDEGATLTFTVTATTNAKKNNGDPVTLQFQWGNKPQGASFQEASQVGNQMSATFSWTPGSDQAGSYSPNFTFNEIGQGGGGTITRTVNITVGNVNQQPVLNNIPNQTVAENALLSFTIHASDPDGDAVTLSASGLPLGASFSFITNPNDPSKGNGTFSWTPNYNQAGNYQVLFTVTDTGSPQRSASQTVTITVGNTNRPPKLNLIGSQTVNENQNLTINVSGSDDDGVYDPNNNPYGNILTFSAANLPPGATFDPVAKTFSWTPNYDQAGNYWVTFTVTDNGVPSLSASEVVTISVGNVNRPPVLDEIGNKTVNDGELLTFPVTGGDPDTGDAVTFSASNLPGGASFDPATLSFSSTPTRAQVGVYSNVKFTVTDGGGLSTDRFITITVGHVNQAPVLTPIGAKGGDEGQPLTFTVSATDADGDSLTYAAAPLPLGASFDPVTGEFAWTPEYTQSGSYNVLFTVTDSKLGASEAITITIGNVNRPPVLKPIGAQQVNEGETLTFKVEATDADGDTLTYSASTLPKGASFDAGSQTFTWTPEYDQANTYKVLFSVADNVASASEEITITVGNVNRPPVLDDITDKQVDENKLLEFVVTATDPDQDALTFSASNLPGDATFDKATSKFSWTPGYDQAGSYQNITFTVIDGQGGTDSKSITITVANVNRPPVLDPIGSKSVLEDQLLTITLTGSDPDNDALTFSADSLPPGAAFNGNVFTWRPDYTQGGTSYDVNFYVTDNGGTPLGLDQETVTITVGNVNRAPIFTPVGSVKTKEGETCSFTVSATDPDGNRITYSCPNYPYGATFDAETHKFTWPVEYGQAGSYTVTFYATDDDPDSLTSETSVVISVDQPSPSELINSIVKYVMSLHLAKNVENSYIANLKKVDGFIAKGQKTAALNQLDAFIQKVNQDLKKGGLIPLAPANRLIIMANELIDMLNR